MAKAKSASRWTRWERLPLVAADVASLAGKLASPDPAARWEARRCLVALAQGEDPRGPGFPGLAPAVREAAFLVLWEEGEAARAGR